MPDPNVTTKGNLRLTHAYDGVMRKWGIIDENFEKIGNVVEDAVTTAKANQPGGYLQLNADGDAVGKIVITSVTSDDLKTIRFDEGELGFCASTGELYLGDGVTQPGKRIYPDRGVASTEYQEYWLKYDYTELTDLGPNYLTFDGEAASVTNQLSVVADTTYFMDCTIWRWFSGGGGHTFWRYWLGVDVNNTGPVAILTSSTKMTEVNTGSYAVPVIDVNGTNVRIQGDNTEGQIPCIWRAKVIVTAVSIA